MDHGVVRNSGTFARRPSLSIFLISSITVQYVVKFLRWNTLFDQLCEACCSEQSALMPLRLTREYKQRQRALCRDRVKSLRENHRAQLNSCQGRPIIAGRIPPNPGAATVSFVSLTNCRSVHARSVLAGIRQHPLRLRSTDRMLISSGELVP